MEREYNLIFEYLRDNSWVNEANTLKAKYLNKDIKNHKEFFNIVKNIFSNIDDFDKKAFDDYLYEADEFYYFGFFWALHCADDKNDNYFYAHHPIIYALGYEALNTYLLSLINFENVEKWDDDRWLETILDKIEEVHYYEQIKWLCQFQNMRNYIALVMTTIIDNMNIAKKIILLLLECGWNPYSIIKVDMNSDDYFYFDEDGWEMLIVEAMQQNCMVMGDLEHLNLFIHNEFKKYIKKLLLKANKNDISSIIDTYFK